MKSIRLILALCVSGAVVISCSKSGDEFNNESGNQSAADLTSVRLNEIDGAEDFIELYNTGTQTVSLEGAKIRRWRVADGIDDEQTLWEGTTETIAAGAYLCLRYDETKVGVAGYLKRDFSSRKNTSIWLQDANETVVSEFSRGTKSVGWNQIHMQRCRNASEVAYSYSFVGTKWVYAESTPASANGSRVGEIDQTMMPVVMNEIDLESGKIELYNASDAEVNLIGFQLRWSRMKDDDADNRTIWEATKKTVIPAKGYLVVESEISLSEYASKNFHLRLRDSSHQDFMGEKYVWDDFKRGSKGEGWTTVTLTSPIVGSMVRIPDGTGDWYLAGSASLGSTNGTSLSGKLVPDGDWY